MGNDTIPIDYARFYAAVAFAQELLRDKMEQRARMQTESIDMICGQAISMADTLLARLEEEP